MGGRRRRLRRRWRHLRRELCGAGGVEEVIPVDLHIGGCPPSPTDLLKGLLALLKSASRNSRRGRFAGADLNHRHADFQWFRNPNHLPQASTFNPMAASIDTLIRSSSASSRGNAPRATTSVRHPPVTRAYSASKKIFDLFGRASFHSRQQPLFNLPNRVGTSRVAPVTQSSLLSKSKPGHVRLVPKADISDDRCAMGPHASK